MKRVNVSELSGKALDWAVAKAENFSYGDAGHGQIYIYKEGIPLMNAKAWTPSTDWAQGGPIIEREGIDLYCNLVGQPDHKDPSWQKSDWRARYLRMGYGTDHSYGSTPLIAAMRCYVASKLGDEIEVPEELL